MKANLLKKIILNALITMNIEEKRNLGLKNTVGEVEIEPRDFPPEDKEPTFTSKVEESIWRLKNKK